MDDAKDIELQEIKEPLTPQIEYYKSIFDKFDTDHSGEISVTELSNLLTNGNYDRTEIPSRVVETVHNMADTNHDGTIDFQEFVDMMKNPDLRQYFRRYMDRYVEALIPPSTRRARKKDYMSQYKCCPPPIGMILISAVEILIHAIDAVEGHDTKYATGPLAVLLIFNPFRRKEFYRFLTYMFVHAGGLHLASNLVIQIVLAIPLEMVHKWWRILLIYFAGVVCASLGHSVFHPYSKLAGASGGTYSIITAHIATIIMNWSEMKYKVLHLGIFTLYICADLGSAIYDNVYRQIQTNIGYIAHLCGAIAGLLVGINVMRNLRQTNTEIVIWWISLVLFSCLVATGVVLNIFWTEHFPTQSV